MGKQMANGIKNVTANVADLSVENVMARVPRVEVIDHPEMANVLHVKVTAIDAHPAAKEMVTVHRAEMVHPHAANVTATDHHVEVAPMATVHHAVMVTDPKAETIIAVAPKN